MKTKKFEHQWMQYKFLPSGLRAEICCNGEKKDFQVESGLSRDLFASTGTYVHKIVAI